MATPILLPKLDMTMAEGTLSRWHKQEGDAVKVGDLLFEVEADKLNMDIDAPVTGILRGVAYPAGSRLPIGTVIAYILAEGEALPEGAGAAPSAPAAPAEAGSAASSGDTNAFASTQSAQAAPVASGDDRVRATPAARRVARERGLDLALIAGSGPNGRIHEADVLAVTDQKAARLSPVAQKMAADLGVDTRGLTGSGIGGKVMKADVERIAGLATGAAASVAAQAHTPPAAAAEDAERVKVSGARAVISRRMSESWQAPHVTLTMEADCAELVRLRTRLNGAAGVKVSYNTLVAYFTAKALAKFPTVNATWDGPDLLRHKGVHLAVAVDAPNGLMVPVVRHADRLGIEALGAAVTDLANRARSGGLTPGDMSGGTFSISNLGSFGIEAFTPIINPPQVAILGVGAIIDKIVPVDGAPAVRPRLTLSLSFDHRAIDGADGARFLAHLRTLIECPERVLL